MKTKEKTKIGIAYIYSICISMERNRCRWGPD